MCLHYRIEKLNHILAFALIQYQNNMKREDVNENEGQTKERKGKTLSSDSRTYSQKRLSIYIDHGQFGCDPNFLSFSSHLSLPLHIFYVIQINFMFPLKLYAGIFRFRKCRHSTQKILHLQFSIHFYKVSLFFFYFFTRWHLDEKFISFLAFLQDKRKI